MVGHSQLESDMLEASLPSMPAADGDDESVAEPAQAAAVDEAPMAKDNSDDDDTEAGTSGVDGALQGLQNGPDHGTAAQGSPMPLPQPGRKRKRSSLCRGGYQDAAPVGLCLCRTMLPTLAAAVQITCRCTTLIS